MKLLFSNVRFSRNTLILLAILLLGFYFRFTNNIFRYSLGDESIRDAVVAVEGVRQVQLPLLGPFSSLGPFTFGPWYWYQLTLFTFLTQSGYGPWIYLGITSLFYIFLMYKIGSLLEKPSLGLLLAFISAIVPPLIEGAIGLTNPNFIHIHALVCVYLFLLLLKHAKSIWWYFLFGFVFGMGVNIHYQMVGLGILPVILLVSQWKQYRKFLWLGLGVFITFLPILFFELNNHWFTFRNMLYYYMYGKNAIYVPNRWLTYVFDFWPSFWADALGITKQLSIIPLAIVISVFSYLLFTKKITKPLFLLLIAFGFNFILLRYYWGERFFGYLNHLRVFVYLFTGYAFWQASKIKFGGIILFGLLAVYSLFVLQRDISFIKSDPFVVYVYKVSDILSEKYKGKKFTIYYCKGNERSHLYSLMYVLDIKEKLGEGIKIGLSSKCKNQLKSSQIEGTGFFDLSQTSKDELVKNGWSELSPKSVFTSTTRWWFKEQP